MKQISKSVLAQLLSPRQARSFAGELVDISDADAAVIKRLQRRSKTRDRVIRLAAQALEAEDPRLRALARAADRLATEYDICRTRFIAAQALLRKRVHSLECSLRSQNGRTRP